ncbi:hypothetical protein [Amycolatopsis viridis]|uniref:Uncharacterized protein n=1 Tax=Amycolatopsis viridis TaxID=185678 RepID=A0ABX0SR03_9PSEU|nr:hypothetical protein [Amycolatopsis viridis]NIH78924.1 hypothetical protein [Amycolatopsis viridis]
MATDLTVFSDYRQIHLLDSGSSTELADQWSDSALFHYLALADDAIGIWTGVNGDVIVTIDVTDVAPADDKDAFDIVTECSLRAASGALRLTSPTYGEDDGDLVTVPRGWLRLRLSLTRTPGDWPHVRIQCWPAEPTDAVLVKGWNPETGSFHPGPRN